MFSKIRNYSQITQIVIILILIPFFYHCGSRKAETDEKELVFRGNTMGTTYSIKLNLFVSNNIDFSKLKNEIDDRLLQINREVSTYIEDSELSLLNKSENTGWQTVSTTLYDSLKVAMYISLASEGAYDFTINPLVNLWGFGSDDFKKDGRKTPEKVLIDIALKKIGYTNLELSDRDEQVIKHKSDLEIDLSSIAKGYAVDRITEILIHVNHSNQINQPYDTTNIFGAMVEIGGEIKCFGVSYNKKLWKIGIRTPTDKKMILHKIVQLENESIATSGDYENYFEDEAGKRSHIIDPKTGYPIKHSLASVSVIHEDCQFADGMATALLVLGLEKGKELVEKQKLAAFFIYRGKADKWLEWMSPNFEKKVFNP